jgi:hypothetical protein
MTHPDLLKRAVSLGIFLVVGDGIPRVEKLIRVACWAYPVPDKMVRVSQNEDRHKPAPGVVRVLLLLDAHRPEDIARGTAARRGGNDLCRARTHIQLIFSRVSDHGLHSLNQNREWLVTTPHHCRMPFVFGYNH